MSKKTPVKKSKRRLKRSVRRSLAAVLMITAIAVAAIPVPENYAEDGSNTGDGGSTTPAASSAAAYMYPTEKMYTVDDKGNATKDAQYYSDFGLGLEKPKDEKKILRTHYIASTTPDDENGGVSFRMEWQYEFFLKEISNLNKGIICGYNDSYNVNTLVVSTEPIQDYYVVDKTIVEDGKTLEKNPDTGIITYDAFKDKEINATNPVKFTLQSKPVEGDPYDDEFKVYFPDEYERQVQLYAQYEQDKATYQTRLDKYNTDRNKKEADLRASNPDFYTATYFANLTEAEQTALFGEKPEEPKMPVPLEREPKDFPTDNDEYAWRLFYCNRNGLKGYILTRVADSEKMDTTTGHTVYSYVPRRIDLSTIDTSDPGDDELGFKVLNKTAFLGIGDNAFKGVANVANIELPDALKYIGDNAFEGSFITSIKMMNLETIGNYAFKNCPRLNKIEMVQGVKYIGTEAFYGLTLIREVIFPGEIEYVGPGAFANCALLGKIDFSTATLEVVIDDYAFYNDGALSEVNFTTTGSKDNSVYITTIGKCAFAVWDGVSGSLSEFVFPSRISQKRADLQKGYPDGYAKKGLGDYILAGRTNLKDVTMPAAYGMSSELELPGHIFQNCIALERVNFPDTGQSCGFVTFPEDFFASVSNPNFYVQGPPYTEPSNRDPALPRKSTWVAYSAAAAIKDGKRVPNIPYVYYLNGIRYTEVCNGNYLMCIDENGVLISCSLKPDLDFEPKEGSIDLVIPAEVAGTVVTGIASDCFAGDANEPNNRKMSKVVRTLTIQDGSRLATINNNVFANWDKLERVYFGDSVRNVGDNAFQDCLSLVDVYFNTPDSAAAEFKMGTNAFQTNSAELTFHGPISTDFAPYDWAVMKDTVIDNNGRGKRICYKSLTPTYFTVMRDNGTSEPTLLDYPKYDQIAAILGESYAVKNGYYIDSYFNAEEYYSSYMESMYYSLYSAAQYDAMRTAFKEAWNEKGEAVYKDFEVYGPWINQTWIDSPQGFGGGTSSGTTSSGSTDSSDAGSAILDFFFEPIIVQAANGKPDAYFDQYPYDVYENLERPSNEAYGDYQRYTLEEYNLLNATRNVTVPDGVTSIDVRAFLTREPNSPNLSYIDRSKVGLNSYNMYNNHSVSSLTYDRTGEVYAGLFSGDYTDYNETTNKENLSKGNDRLESVNLNQVKSLPDYAFDSCESLKSVTIGAACTDIKNLPFRGCTSLTTLNVAEENPKYTAENRILYAKNDASSYTIVECLESRGRNNDNSVVTSAVDVNLPLVTSIADGAFEECNNVSTINLSDATGLTVVPERAFMHCDGLNEVDLPLSVNKIDKDAFKDDLIGRVKIPGREVFISTNAFNELPSTTQPTNKTQPTYIITYEDSSARRYADTYGEQYNLVWEDVGELWNVNFYDFDGTLLKAMQVQDGWAVKTSEIPEATREGYTFLKWVGTNNVGVQDEITQDTDFIATYSSTSQMVDGKWVVNFIDGVTATSCWPTQYVEDGETVAEFPPTPPAYHEGYTFTKFVANIGGKAVDFTETTEVTSNITVVALYAVNGSGTPGGPGNTTSGSTTNTSGNSTNNTSGSTTNTSDSSTSTTSSTGEKPRHTVTVVNGYGSGSYAEGETVIIVANEPAAGQKFSQWRTESQGVELVMILASATTFVMPANNVLVTAEFTGGSATPTTTALQTPASGTVATNTGTTGNSSNNGNTRVDITKPGISNKNLATANTNGSTDNFIVKISETPEATQAVQNALTNKYGNLDNILYYAMDISLYDSTGTTKITDTTGLSVDITIPIPDALVAYGGNNMMGAVVGNDQLEDMSERFTTIGGVPCISFTATHFSPYTIYVNTQNLSEGLLDITPKTGDPIHPKWFLSIGLAALSIILFMKKDKKTTVKTA